MPVPPRPSASGPAPSDPNRRPTRSTARGAPRSAAAAASKPALKNPFFLVTAIATVAAVAAAITVYALHDDDSKAKKKSGESVAAASGASGAAGDASKDAKSPTPAPATSPNGTPSSSATPASSPPPAPTVKYTVEEVDAKLKDATTADAAVALGDRLLRETRDQVLAERAYKKALELDPENKGAKRGLEIRAIDPEKDFPGFDDVDMTPQRYLLVEFQKLRGKSTTRVERDQAIARWNEQRHGIEQRVKEADHDPYLTTVDKTRNNIATIPYFEHFQYDVIETTRPYALFVELKGESVTEREERRAAIEKSYKPFLDAHAKAIENYLCKLAPKPPKDEPTFVVFFLLDRASYERFFQEFEHGAAPPGVRAHYTNVQRWAFTYTSDVSNLESADFTEGTQVLLHELTHAWVDRLATDGSTTSIRLVKTHWFNEGIAEYMSCQFLDHGTVQFQPWRSMRLKEAGERPPGCRIPLERAFRIAGNGELMEEARLAADVQKALPKERAMGMLPSGFYTDMSLFIFWVNYGNDRKYKKQFENYVRKELAGEGGPDVAAQTIPEVFGRHDLEAAIDAFQKQVSSGQVKFQNHDLAIEQ